MDAGIETLFEQARCDAQLCVQTLDGAREIPRRACRDAVPAGRALEAELEGVDVRAELRRYSMAQLLLFVPALIAVIAIAQAAWAESGARAGKQA